jgi:hypothetical protein
MLAPRGCYFPLLQAVSCRVYDAAGACDGSNLRSALRGFCNRMSRLEFFMILLFTAAASEGLMRNRSF